MFIHAFVAIRRTKTPVTCIPPTRTCWIVHHWAPRLDWIRVYGARNRPVALPFLSTVPTVADTPGGWMSSNAVAVLSSKVADFGPSGAAVAIIWGFTFPRASVAPFQQTRFIFSVHSWPPQRFGNRLGLHSYSPDEAGEEQCNNDRSERGHLGAWVG